MTTVSGFNAYSWLSQIQGTAPKPAPSPTPAPTSYSYPTPTVDNVLGVSSNIFSLLGGGGVGTSANNMVSTLLGGGSASSNPMAGVYNALLYSNSAPTALTSATNAYNNALLAQTQSLIQANLGLIA